LQPLQEPAEEEVQVQPQVTIFMTLTLSEDYSGGFLGEVPRISIQRTVSSSVYSEIESYE